MFWLPILALLQFLDSHSGEGFICCSLWSILPVYSALTWCLMIFSLDSKKKEDQSCSFMVHCRSSGLRVSTAAGSTAAMLSAGGFAMPILSQDLQYIVREPIAPGAYNSLMHGTVKPEELMEIAWYCKEGLIYIDGSHLIHSVQHGDIIELSSKAPKLKVFLPSHLISWEYITELSSCKFVYMKM